MLHYITQNLVIWSDFALCTSTVRKDTIYKKNLILRTSGYMLLNQMSKDIYSWKSECLFLTQKHYVLWICCRIWTCLTLPQEGITAKTALSRDPNHPSNDLIPCPCTDFITHTTDQGCICLYLVHTFTKGLILHLSLGNVYKRAQCAFISCIHNSLTVESFQW